MTITQSLGLNETIHTDSDDLKKSCKILRPHARPPLNVRNSSDGLAENW